MQALPVVLVAEDDQLLQGLVEEALTEGGFEIAIAATGEEAITLLKGDRRLGVEGRAQQHLAR